MRFRSLIHEGGRARVGALAAVAALALVMAACSADYVETSEAPVLLVLQSLNGGAQLDSDVRNGEFSTFICEDEVDVTVAVQPKNPTLVSAPSASVKLDSYEVRYTRTDGRGTEGVDVPYRVTGTLTQVIEMNGAATIPIEVVRRQAKLDPPLNNINQTTVLTVNAQVILFGKTIADQRVSTSGWMQIDFADFGDEDTACPSN